MYIRLSRYARLSKYIRLGMYTNLSRYIKLSKDVKLNLTSYLCYYFNMHLMWFHLAYWFSLMYITTYVVNVNDQNWNWSKLNGEVKGILYHM
jgi:hypothetical protein